MDKIVNEIVAKIIAACKADPSDDTLRCITIMVRAMFNWTKATDAGSVGFQMQQIVYMLKPTGSESWLSMNDYGVKRLLERRAGIRAARAERLRISQTPVA